MVKVVIDNAKGLVQYAGSGVEVKSQDIKSPGLKHMGYVDNETAFVRNSDSIVEWTQPANTILWSISLVCTSAPETGASIDLGYEVGTSSSGGEIVTAITDEIIDGGADGTDLAVGAFIPVAGPGTVGNTKTIAHLNRRATSATTLAADVNYTSADRTLYFNTTASDVAVTTPGTIRWLIEYIQVAN